MRAICVHNDPVMISTGRTMPYKLKQGMRNE
jgi:hypothetical protein